MELTVQLTTDLCKLYQADCLGLFGVILVLNLVQWIIEQSLLNMSNEPGEYVKYVTTIHI